MRIFHLADCHFSNDRLEHKVAAFEKCLKKMDEVVMTDKIAVLAGDIFDHSLRMEDPGAQEAVRLIGELNSMMPVLMIKGNYTHDRDSVELFDAIPSAYPLITSVRPEVVLVDSMGDIEKVSIEEAVQKHGHDNAPQATFVTLPYPSYSFVAADQALPPEGLRVAVFQVASVFQGNPSRRENPERLHVL